MHQPTLAGCVGVGKQIGVSPLMHSCLKIVLISLLLIPLHACSDHEEANIDRASSVEQFAIFLLSDRVIDELPYDYNDAAWTNLLKQPPAGQLLVTDEEIEAYDWQRQTLLLTSPASKRLAKQILAGLNERAFTVFLAGKLIFAGSFIEPVSARAIRYPVIYTYRQGDQLIFCIRPEHSPLRDDENSDQSLRARVAPVAIKNHFESLAKLRLMTDQSVCR